VGLRDYDKAIDAAKAETRKLLQQRATIDARLAQLTKTIAALTPLVKRTSENDRSSGTATAGKGLCLPGAGITAAIRQMLTTHSGPLSPRQIREWLNQEGFDINSYASGLTLIHNTLKRLQTQGEVDLVRTPHGITAYPSQKGE
jgi:hypothetical protein